MLNFINGEKLKLLNIDITKKDAFFKKLAVVTTSSFFQILSCFIISHFRAVLNSSFCPLFSLGFPFLQICCIFGLFLLLFPFCFLPVFSSVYLFRSFLFVFRSSLLDYSLSIHSSSPFFIGKLLHRLLP